MSIEDQVVSLELAKRLKGIGVFTVAEMIVEVLPPIIKKDREYWLRIEPAAVGGGDTIWAVKYVSSSDEVLKYTVNRKLADALAEMQILLQSCGLLREG